MFKVGDRVRYKAGVNMAFPATDRPDRRNVSGTVTQIVESGTTNGLYLLIKWEDGIVERAAIPAGLFEMTL